MDILNTKINNILTEKTLKIRPENIKKNVTAFGITGTYEGEGGSFPPDWSEIGYEDTPASIINDFNYAKEIQENWDSSITSMNNKYLSSTNLKIFPLVDTVITCQGINFPLACRACLADVFPKRGGCWRRWQMLPFFAVPSSCLTAFVCSWPTARSVWSVGPPCFWSAVGRHLPVRQAACRR